MPRSGYDRYYQPEKGSNNASVQIRWNNPVNIGHIVLKENIYLSQRVESFYVEASENGEFVKVFEGTVIGHKRIIPFPAGLVTDHIRIVITDSRMEPTLAFVEIYEKVEG